MLREVMETCRRDLFFLVFSIFFVFWQLDSVSASIVCQFLPRRQVWSMRGSPPANLPSNEGVKFIAISKDMTVCIGVKEQSGNNHG